VNAVLVMLLTGLFFYFVHRMHEQVGSYGGGHPAGPRTAPPAAEPPSGWSFAPVLALTLVLLLPLIIFFLGGVKHEAALNELPAPGWRRRAVGALAFALLFLIMAPVPHRFMTTLGILCPYV